MSTSETEQYPAPPKPDPTTLNEALARLNTTPEQAWDLAVRALARLNTTPEQAWDLAVRAKWGFASKDSDGDSQYEYDQGDILTVEYDNLYDLADIALAAMKLAGGGPADPVSDGTG